MAGGLSFSGIYALTCPRTGEIRYIGRSVNIAKRYASHRQQVGACSLETHYGRWMNSLTKPPGIVVIESTESTKDAEIKHIKEHKDAGFNLVNTGSGGEGYPDEPIYVLSRKMRSMFGNKSRAFLTSKHLIDEFNNSSDFRKSEINVMAAQSMEKVL